MVNTDTKLIGGGTIALIALGIGAYLIYRKEIGQHIEDTSTNVNKVLGGAGDLTQGTVGAVNTITGETSETFKSIMDVIQGTVSKVGDIWLTNSNNSGTTTTDVAKTNTTPVTLITSGKGDYAYTPAYSTDRNMNRNITNFVQKQSKLQSATQSVQSQLKMSIANPNKNFLVLARS